MTGMAVCEKTAMSPQAASPLVTCRTERVTVKLPRDAELKKVKRHGKNGLGHANPIVRLMALMQISTCQTLNKTINVIKLIID